MIDLVDLFERARVGEARAYEEIDAFFRPIILAYAHGRFGVTLEDAEDVAQDVMVRVITRAPHVQHTGNLYGWVMRLAHNRCLDLLRRRAIIRVDAYDPVLHEYYVASDDPAFGNPEALVLRDERRQAIRAALARVIPTMSPLTADALARYHLRDRTVAEVAEELGVTRQAIKSRTERARQRLRRHPAIRDLAA